MTDQQLYTSLSANIQRINEFKMNEIQRKTQ